MKFLSLTILSAALTVTSASAQAGPATTTTVVPTPVPATVNILDPIAAPAANAGFHSTQKATSVSGEQNGEAWKSGLNGQDSNVLTTEGTIEKYIKFKSVDSNLELGDLGKPTRRGSVYSNADLDTAAKGDALLTLPKDSGQNGLAEITFDANTYVQVRLNSERQLVNEGADGVADRSAVTNTNPPTGGAARPASKAFDNYVIPIQYRIAAKGKFIRSIQSGGGSAGPAPVTELVGAASSAYKANHAAFNSAYTTPVVGRNDGYGPYASDSTSRGTEVDPDNIDKADDEVNTNDSVTTDPPQPNTDAVLTFEPNGGASGNGLTNGTGSNGVKVGARIQRSGLNDYHGKYSAKVFLSYWQW